MKIYFAGSIRSGRDDADLYLKLIEHLKQYGEVLTAHIGYEDLEIAGEDVMNDDDIHNRDLEWILQSNIVVAEVTTPSLGVGYEIGRAIENEIKVLCLYRFQDSKKLSAMIAGSPDVDIKEYKTLNEAKDIIDNYFG